ncbi:hypothetical protein XM38_037250 [Halomicronema hongdechloris C2206]|uniref:Uncharacterized protein n=1 Tax=Halomicronema hongdechloris C2206 TaxID=1641165 RepID=A0A1Z3HR90_9CYAN|nr:hypothetical protein XM38_037250 [Halomicronema hongdechloris C2206]
MLLTALMLLGVAWTISQWSAASPPRLGPVEWAPQPQPLAMQGGDPYIRALMRTISAAESNTRQPYHVLYGGYQVDDLSQHPETCITIVTGPNKGDCTTAAGRYQFLDTTWSAKAEKYHPQPPPWYEVWQHYSFEPQFQDAVVYRWLSDPSAWGVDLALLLRQGELQRVLKILSGTWTSLGYGIEDNSMTTRLPRIYEAMLQEELARTSAVPSKTSPGSS